MFILAWESSKTMPFFRFAVDTFQISLTNGDWFKLYDLNSGVISILK